MRVRPVYNTTTDNVVKLRITRAYTKLLTIPETAKGAGIVSLLRVGNCEIGIFKPSQADPFEPSLFWMELFDHGSQSTLDSCCCRDIEVAVTAFNDFVEQASGPDKCSLKQGGH